MTFRLSAFLTFFARAAEALRVRIDRSHEATTGLEAYLSTATSLHQLEDMQRSWDRHHRGARSLGAY